MWWFTTIHIPSYKSPDAFPHLCGHQVCMWCLDIHGGKTFMHIKLNKHKLQNAFHSYVFPLLSVLVSNL